MPTGNPGDYWKLLVLINSVSNRRELPSKIRRQWPLLFLAAAVWFTLPGIGRTQEALRVSMAGDLAAAAQQQANSTIGYYNLLLGPTAWRFSAGLGLEYNSNVRLEPNGGGDLIIQPSVDVDFHWPVTLKNSLDISLAAGYSEYLRNPDLSQLFINPGSGLSFNVYVGDFKINLHDRVSITQNAYQNAGVSGGNQNLSSMENTVGIAGTWDLDKLVTNLGFDHVNNISLSSSPGQLPDGSSENLFVNSGIRVRPELLLGLEAGGSVITYNQSSSANAPAYPNAVQWSVGAFGSAKLTEHMDVRLDAGFTDYMPDSTTSTNLVAHDAAGLYFSLSLSHRVNNLLNYTLSAGRNADLASYGQPQAYYFVRFTPNWNLLQKYSISTPLWWQKGKWLYNSIASPVTDYQQVGAGITVSRGLTKKLSASVGYQFVKEISSQASLNYTVNTLGLNLSYQF